MTGIIESKINRAKEGVLVLKTKWDQDGQWDCNAAFDRINQALDQINTGVQVDVDVVRNLGDWDVKEYFTRSRDYSSLKFQIDSGVTKYDEKTMGFSKPHPTGFLARATNNKLLHFNWMQHTDGDWEVIWREEGPKGELVVQFKVPNEDLWLSATSASGAVTLVPWPSGTKWAENPALLFSLFGTLQNCKIGSVQVNDAHTKNGAYLRGIAPLRAKPTHPSLEPEKGVPVSASGADGYPGVTWTLTYISGGTFTASGEHARV